MFAKTGGRTNCENVIGRNASLQLSANYLGLPVDTSKCRDDEQSDAVGERCSLETSPRFGGRRNEQMISAIRSHLGALQIRRLFALSQSTSRNGVHRYPKCSKVRVHADRDAQYDLYGTFAG